MTSPFRFRDETCRLARSITRNAFKNSRKFQANGRKPTSKDNEFIQSEEMHRFPVENVVFCWLLQVEIAVEFGPIRRRAHTHNHRLRHQTQLQQPGRASAHMRCCQIAANADLFPRSRHSTAPAATKTTRGDSERKPCRLTTHPFFHTEMGGALHMEQDMPFIPSKFTVTIISIHKSINNDGALQSKHKSFP